MKDGLRFVRNAHLKNLKSLILVKKSTNKNLKNLKIFSIIYIESRERDFKLIPFF
nr:MAG TPA: hypothetical protein [Caudoviricetes sp.]